MTGQSLIANKFHPSFSHETDGQKHLDDASDRGQEIVGFIENAMSQSGTYQDAHEAIDEEGVE